MRFSYKRQNPTAEKSLEGKINTRDDGKNA